MNGTEGVGAFNWLANVLKDYTVPHVEIDCFVVNVKLLWLGVDLEEGVDSEHSFDIVVYFGERYFYWLLMSVFESNEHRLSGAWSDMLIEPFFKV